MSIGQIEAKLVIVCVAAVVHSAYLALAVGSPAVRDASQAYGRQLLLSTETFIAAARAGNAKPRRSRTASPKPQAT